MKYNDNSSWYVSSETGMEPVTLDELKAHLNMSFTGSASYNDDDNYLNTLITNVRDAVERYCSISIKGKTVVVELRNELGNADLPLWPIYDIVSAVDRDNNDVVLTVLGDNLKTIESPVTDYIKITYTAGFMRFGSAYVPKSIKQAILEEAAYRYTHRGISDAGMSESAKVLLSQFKKKSWLA